MKRFAIFALATLAACDGATLPAPVDTDALQAYAAPVTDGFVPMPDGAQLFYRVAGTGPDTVVVLSGGPGLSFRYMYADLQALSHGRTVIWFDPRGAGSSTLTPPPGMPQHVADLETIRAHFGMPRMKLIGHSFGALVAVEYAAAHPTRVDRLLLLNPAPVAAVPYGVQFDSERNSRFTPAQGMLIGTLQQELLSGTSATPVESCERFFDTVFSVYFHDPANMARMQSPFCDVTPQAALAALPALFGGLGQLGLWDYTQTVLPSIQVPALVVHGSADPIPLASSQVFASTLPRGALAVLPEAGHFPWLETPDAFYEAINPFLNRAFPHAD